MTAKFLHSFPARNAFRLVSQNKKFAIVTCILQVLGIPLIMGGSMLDIYYSNIEKYYSSTEAYVLIGSFCLSISVILGIFFGINAYREEWDKSKVDMLYALPLTGKQRFFSNYLGGLGMYLIPYLAAVILGWIVMLACSPLVRSVLKPEEIGDLNQIYWYYFLLTTGLLLLMWMYYTISALVASCCGTLFENIYSNILLNILIPGTLAAVLAVVTSEIETMEFGYSWDFIGYTSPIGGLIYLVYLIVGKSEVFSEYYYSSTYRAVGGELGDMGLVPAYLRWILIIAVVTVALLFLAWKLYEHRKAEHVSRPFIYIGIYYIMLTAITICILCIIATEIDALIPVLIFSAIVYFIMEVIRKRGFKKFWLSAICYVITVVVALAGMFSISATNAFGRAYYIPALASVTSAKLEISDYASDGSVDCQLNFNDKEIISEIQEFQRECIAHQKTDYKAEIREAMNGYNKLSYYDNNYTTEPDAVNEYDNLACAETTITYYTITGSAIHRTYTLLSDEYMHLIDICVGTDVYAEANANILKARLKNAYQQFYPDEKEPRYPASVYFVVDPPSSLGSYYYSESDAVQKLNISDVENNLRLFAECYQRDLTAMTSKDYRTSRIICSVKGMPVRECNQETYALLKNWGLKEFSLNILYNTSEDNIQNIRLYAPEQYITTSLQYPSNTLQSFRFQPDNHNATDNSQNIPSYQDVLPVGISETYTALQEFYPEIYDLLKSARKHYVSSEPCYLLVINGNYYLIPPEDSEKAEEVIARGDYYCYPFEYTANRNSSYQYY